MNKIDFGIPFGYEFFSNESVLFIQLNKIDQFEHFLIECYSIQRLQKINVITNLALKITKNDIFS